MADSPTKLRCHEVRTRFGDKDVLRGVSLMLEAGRTVALQGRSGAGKSSLLLALAGLRTISSGEIEFNGVRYDHLSDSKRARIRLKSFGVVFQQGRLVPELSVGENVELGLRLLGSGRRDAIRRSREQLDVLGVGDLYNRALSEISGGQEQRVAIARALVHRPSIVLADEPTGSLDAATANSAVVAMLDVVRTSQAAALVVTHDANVAAACDVQMTLVDGRTELASAVAGDKGDVATVVATCAQLRSVLDTALPDCANDRRMWLSRTGADARVEHSTSIELPDARRARLPDRAQVLATGKTDLFDGMLFAPDLVSTNVATSPRFIVAVNAESASTIMAGISSAAPAVGFFFGSQYAADVDSQEYSTQITWLAMALAVALFIAWLAMCVSAIGESFARRDQLRGLYLLGAGQRDVIRAYGASLLFPLLVVPAFAIAIGVVINFQAAMYDDRATIRAQTFILIFAVSAILATATWLLTLQNVLRADRGWARVNAGRS